jgi:hypothetical protein
MRRVIGRVQVVPWKEGLCEVLGWEGCLSIPEGMGQVRRAHSIRVVALSEKGEPIDPALMLKKVSLLWVVKSILRLYIPKLHLGLS